jgi:high frequency lysogenization protein
MPQTDHDRAIAMAGLIQAIRLVSEIAHRGRTNPQDYHTCLASLLKISPASSEDIYGGIANLRSGLQLLSNHLRHPTDMEISRYVVTLLVLERKLAKRPDLLSNIRAGIEATIERLHHLPLNHDITLAGLADIYSSTVSSLEPRIMVYGDPAYLNNPDNANRIRALLLAGIRAAILWRQSGGGRLTLLFRRKALLREVQRLLSSVVDD